jgi:hypothetical protein
MMKKAFFDVKRYALFLLVSSLFTACASQSPALYEADLQKMYHSAVVDAAIAEPSEISKNLVAVVPSNPRLVWKNRDDVRNARLLVVTWTNYNGYDEKIGQTINLSQEVWVTTAPEVKNLGLPPKAGKTRFVEMWVKPGDLFRPSADPEITDSEAEIEFRISNKYVKVSDEYIKWYGDLKKQSYGANGYPWTRLGYTYDWGNNQSHIGVSEFVIMPGAAVEIERISSTKDY